MALRHKERDDPDPQVRQEWQLNRIRQAVEFLAFGLPTLALIIGLLWVLAASKG